MIRMTDRTPVIDVVIPVHDPRRPVERAIASALADDLPVRVTVVCHGLDPERFGARLDSLRDPRLRVVEFHDGVRSPAGPFNHGIDLATAEYIAVMGSDDHLEPGALRHWYETARSIGADAILAPVRELDGSILKVPLVRPGREIRLDPVRDRLAYRSAAIGLVRRDWMHARRPFFEVGLRTGEDIARSMELWFTGGALGFPRSGPAYVGGYEVEGHTSQAPFSVSDALEPVRRLRRTTWLPTLTARRRRAIAVRVLRLNLLDGVLRRRPRAEDWTADDVDRVRDVTRSWVGVAPAVLAAFSLSDRALLDRVMEPGVDPAGVAAAIETWISGSSRWRRLLTRNPLRILGADAPARRYLALWRTADMRR
jgi:hypothetical protein